MFKLTYVLFNCFYSNSILNPQFLQYLEPLLKLKSLRRIIESQLLHLIYLILTNQTKIIRITVGNNNTLMNVDIATPIIDSTTNI